MLLLDSMALLWVLVDSPRLGPRSRQRIATSAVVHVSPVTLAELRIKAMIGKLDLPEDVEEAVAGQGLVPLPLTTEHTAALAAFPELARHDPFDRLLLAQAHAAGLDLMTSDRRLLALGRPFVLDATE
ncbi:type II toxin-antitoxin system VapC family toxin [Jatrophihabitans fulvus]